MTAISCIEITTILFDKEYLIINIFLLIILYFLMIYKFFIILNRINPAINFRNEIIKSKED